MASHCHLKLQVWPNPATGGDFTVNFSSVIDEQAQLVVTNIVGMQIGAFAITANRETEINLHVPGGIYLVSISTANGRLIRKVLIE